MKMYFKFGMLFELMMMFLVILGMVFGKCYTEISLIFGVLSLGMFIINNVDEK